MITEAGGIDTMKTDSIRQHETWVTHNDNKCPHHGEETASESELGLGWKGGGEAGMTTLFPRLAACSSPSPLLSEIDS